MPPFCWENELDTLQSIFCILLNENTTFVCWNSVKSTVWTLNRKTKNALTSMCVGLSFWEKKRNRRRRPTLLYTVFCVICWHFDPHGKGYRSNDHFVLLYWTQKTLNQVVCIDFLRFCPVVQNSDHPNYLFVACSLDFVQTWIRKSICSKLTLLSVSLMKTTEHMCRQFHMEETKAKTFLHVEQQSHTLWCCTFHTYGATMIGWSTSNFHSTCITTWMKWKPIWKCQMSPWVLKIIPLSLDASVPTWDTMVHGMLWNQSHFLVLYSVFCTCCTSWWSSPWTSFLKWVYSQYSGGSSLGFWGGWRTRGILTCCSQFLIIRALCAGAPSWSKPQQWAHQTCGCQWCTDSWRSWRIWRYSLELTPCPWCTNVLCTDPKQPKNTTIITSGTDCSCTGTTGVGALVGNHALEAGYHV